MCRAFSRGSCLSWVADVYVINSSRYVVKKEKSQSPNTLFSTLLTEYFQRQEEVDILSPLFNLWGGGGKVSLKS